MKNNGFVTLIKEETGQSGDLLGVLYLYKSSNTHLVAAVLTARSFIPSGLVTERGVIPDYLIKQIIII